MIFHDSNYSALFKKIPDKLVKVLLYPSIAILAGCGSEKGLVTYVCEEPLETYLDLALVNIAKDYEVERSRQLLMTCPDKGFHRRYTFSFQPSAIVSRQAANASVNASWCGDSTEKRTEAKLTTSTSMLTFRFNYPWSTSTGKYPPTEFRVNQSRMKGGFFEDLKWNCRLQKAETAAD